MTYEPARDPQDLERLLIERQWAGDADGMVQLYEDNAILDTGEGTVIVGKNAIHSYFSEVNASGTRFLLGKQSPAMICGDIALTSTRLPDGCVTAEVARRQTDGTWLWIIDKYSII